MTRPQDRPIRPGQRRMLLGTVIEVGTIRPDGLDVTLRIDRDSVPRNARPREQRPDLTPVGNRPTDTLTDP